MENGWIKLHRKVLENPSVLHDAEYFALWVYLLLNASHEEYSTWFNGKRTELKAGQLVTGRKKIAHELRMNEHKVDRALKLFENEQQIEQLCTPNGRLITVKNWQQYQKVEQQDEQRVSNECATTEQRLSTIQELKKTKKVKNNPPIVPLTDNEKLNEAIEAFREHRKTIKSPMTDNAVRLLLKRLRRLSTDPEEQVLMIETAIEHGWKTVYPLKEEDKPKPADDGMGEMERMYYANNSRYDGPDFFARRDDIDGLSRKSG